MVCDPCIKRHFKEVTIEDAKIIEEYLKLCDYEESNHNIINMIEWLDLYPLYEYHGDDFMILIGIYHDEYFMYMPLCHKEKELEVIKLGKNLLDDCNIPFVMSCFTKEYKDVVLNEFNDAQIRDVRDGYDYVYDLEKLRKFKGKKLQKKRNHLNNFYKLYGNDYIYEDINDDNLSDFIKMVESYEVYDENLIAEKNGILRILYNYHKLDFKAGIIKINNKIEGLIVASKLSDRMVQENIEKANKEIVGLSQALIAEFFKRHFLDYKYLNREDDMGEDNLRKSKLSYNPEYLIEKYYINV